MLVSRNRTAARSVSSRRGGAMREGPLSENLSGTVTRDRSTVGRARAERPAWRDRKRYLWLLGTVVPLFLFAGWGLVNATGLGLFWWIGPMGVYVVIPLPDIVIGDDSSNAPAEALAWLENDRYYRWVT